MNLTTRAARRGVAAAAMIAAAILVPTAALATSGRAAAPASTVAPKCATAALSAWMPRLGSGYAGGAVYELEISNISARACTLYGFPGVSALGSNGHQLGSPASWDHAHPSRTATLSPGATAHAVLRIVDVSVFGNPKQPCNPTKAAALRIIPPNDRTSIEIPFPFNACATPGPIYLSVRTTQSGAGIPNFSF